MALPLRTSCCDPKKGLGIHCKSVQQRLWAHRGLCVLLKLLGRIRNKNIENITFVRNVWLRLMHFEKGGEAFQVAQGLDRLLFQNRVEGTGDVLQSRKLLKVQVIGTQTKIHLLELGIVLEIVSPRLQASKKNGY